MMREVELEYLLKQAITMINQTDDFIVYYANYCKAKLLINILFARSAKEQVKLLELGKLSAYVLEYKILNIPRFDNGKYI